MIPLPDPARPTSTLWWPDHRWRITYPADETWQARGNKLAALVVAAWLDAYKDQP